MGSTSTCIIPSSQGHKSGSNNSSSTSENSSVNAADSASSGDDDDKMSDREEQFEMRAWSIHILQCTFGLWDAVTFVTNWSRVHVLTNSEKVKSVSSVKNT